MDDEEKIRHKFFLGTACRDKEVTFAAWSDIDFEKKTYHVRSKNDVGFSPKRHEDRIVPMPTNLRRTSLTTRMIRVTRTVRVVW